MKNAIASCPSPEQLEQFLEELLNDSDQLAVAGHVRACPTCQAALERLAPLVQAVAPLVQSKRRSCRPIRLHQRVPTSRRAATFSSLPAPAAPSATDPRLSSHSALYFIEYIDGG